jgi:thioredoxin-like negative regulator of GroEL
MTSRETELRDGLKSTVESEVLKAGLELANDHLIPRGDFAEAETILLEVLGLQTYSDGFIVQLSLAELYIKMDEIPRAKRFLKTVATSSNEANKTKADALIKDLTHH